jgi:predicted transport protein
MTRCLGTYRAYQRLRNFAYVCPPQKAKLLVFLKADPKEADLVPGFTRRVTGVGHHRTCDLEVQPRTERDLEHAPAAARTRDGHRPEPQRRGGGRSDQPARCWQGTAWRPLTASSPTLSASTPTGGALRAGGKRADASNTWFTPASPLVTSACAT